MKVVLKILAVIIWVILSVLGIAVKTTEKLRNVIAGFLYLIIGVLALMAVLSQQWLELVVFCGMAGVVLAIQFGAATVEALIQVGKSLCKYEFMGSNKMDFEL